MSTSFDPPASTTAEQLYDIGLRAARDASGLRAIEGLFDNHFSDLDYDRELYKQATLQPLRSRASKPFAINCLMRAAEADPENQKYLHAQALLLEELGRFNDALKIRTRIHSTASDWIENHAAICRLRGKFTTADDETPEKYFARDARSIAYYFLTLARLVALNGPKALKDTTIEKLKHRVQDAMTAAPNSVGLNLAMGFISEATKDERQARRYFLDALALRDRPSAGEDHYDTESMNYAQMFILEGGALSEPPSSFSDTDYVNLALARGALLRQEGAIFAALTEYESAIASLAPARSPSSMELYKGYKIVLNEDRYYAVPNNVLNFTIVRGVVIRAPQIVGETTPRFRDWLAEKLGPEGRAMVKRSLRNGLTVVRLIPGSRQFGRRLLHWYVNRYAVQGVLTDNDILMLQERIDTVARSGDPEGASANKQQTQSDPEARQSQRSKVA